MNQIINQLFEQQKQAIAERNQLKYHANKEDDMLGTNFEKVDKRLIRINNELQAEYSKLYRSAK